MAEAVDVAVVGGGPAGLAAALEARAAGCASVRVVDRARPPIDKACGEGLMPDGAACLDELGVELAPGDYAAFRGIRWVDGDTVAEGRFPAGRGLGLRRTRLHAAMVRRAEQAGVELRWGVRVQGLVPGGVETEEGTLAARTVVAADGLRSRLREQAGLAGRPSRLRRLGRRRHYRVAPWSDLVEVHWGRAAEAYVTPVGPAEVGVAFLWSGGGRRFDEFLDEFPALAARLEGAPVVSRDRGAGPLLQRARGVVRGRLVLVGDASGYVDAITGEGLALAFHQARALGQALARDDLAVYARAHRRIGRFADSFTRLLLIVERRPWLRRRVIRALAADPELFSRLLGVHSRELPLSQLGVGGALRLALRVAAA